MTHVVSINSKNLRSVFKISVLKIAGIFDMPGRVSPYERDWKDSDGVDAFTDSEDLYFRQRRITLECIMDAADMMEFQYNLGLFREEVYKQFTLTTPLSQHTCVLKEGAQVKFLTSKYQSGVTASFTLVCNELNYSFGTTFEPDYDISNNEFWIDYTSLSRFGIQVKESSGNFDFPRMKDDRITRYMRESESNNKRGSRNITLSCSMIGSSIADFKSKMQAFHALLAQPGLRKLMFPIPGLEMSYNCLCPDGFIISELVYNDNQVACTFNLTLKEVGSQIETLFLTVLLDIDGKPILDESGNYIIVIADRAGMNPNIAYIFLDSEYAPATYLWTDEELDSLDPDYNANAESKYILLDSEL